MGSKARRRGQRKQRVSPVKYVLLGVIIVSMMGLSFGILYDLGTPFGVGQPGLTYDGIRFAFDQRTGLYTFEYEDQIYNSLTAPHDLAFIEVPNATVEQIHTAREVGIARSSEPDQVLAVSAHYLSDAIRRGTNTNTRIGFTDSTPGISCNDASEQFPVIVYESDSEPGIIIDGACTRIGYNTSFELISHSEALMFRALGITRPR